eukprot:844869-Amorphochlora_amoeboformis.AAC.2
MSHPTGGAGVHPSGRTQIGGPVPCGPMFKYWGYRWSPTGHIGIFTLSGPCQTSCAPGSGHVAVIHLGDII